VYNVILFIGILVLFEFDLFGYFEAAADTAKTIGESLTKRDKFMTPDFIGRCVDAAIPLAIGLIGLLYYPHKVEKNVESGKWSEAEGKKKLKGVWIAYGAITLFGILQIIWLFR
jgi:hypothetical protein